MILQSLTDAELVQHVYMNKDSCSELEQELAFRLQTHLDANTVDPDPDVEIDLNG